MESLRTITPTQAAILAAALQHQQRFVGPPARLAPAPVEEMAWSADGAPAHYRLAEAGLRTAAGTMGTDTLAEGTPPVAADAPKAPEKGYDATHVPGRPPSARQILYSTATAVLAAWDVIRDRAGMEKAMTALRVALAGKASRQPRQPGAPCKPCEGAKQEGVLTMRRRSEV